VFCDFSPGASACALCTAQPFPQLADPGSNMPARSRLGFGGVSYLMECAAGTPTGNINGKCTRGKYGSVRRA
jgi:hypothetical protein